MPTGIKCDDLVKLRQTRAHTNTLFLRASPPKMEQKKLGILGGSRWRKAWKLTLLKRVPSQILRLGVVSSHPELWNLEREFPHRSSKFGVCSPPHPTEKSSPHTRLRREGGGNKTQRIHDTYRFQQYTSRHSLASFALSPRSLVLNRSARAPKARAAMGNLVPANF